jgi:hypothetical protein
LIAALCDDDARLCLLGVGQRKAEPLDQHVQAERVGVERGRPVRCEVCVFADGAGDHQEFKWLDLVAFCRAALPRNDVQLVRYFTAPLDPSRGRDGQRARQEAYPAALRTTPGLVTHYGQFVEHAKLQWLVDAPLRGPKKALVWIPEEKGSDVNLASHLLVDGFTGHYEVAVVVSNDADLLEPVRLVRTVLGLPVGVIKVEGGQRACVFAKQADFVPTVRRSHFTAAQLPLTITTADDKTITKPREW